MYIPHLEVSQVRNLKSLKTDCHPLANIIYGVNGSGKTSLLEAIYLLGRGRSFRHRDLRLVVNHQAEELVVSAKIEKGMPAKVHQMGVRRTSSGKFAARFDGKTLQSSVQLASELPLQLIDAHSFNLLEGGPSQRRQFLAWGVFHVEHSFLTAWRDSRKCLANRNALLKATRLDRPQLEAWDREFVVASVKVDAQRGAYLDRFLPVFKEVYAQLEGSHVDSLEIRYDRGWAEGANLDAELVRTLEVDRRYGSTQLGPQRADILLLLDRTPAVEVLSRGQQKILVSALKIAQGRLLSESLGVECLYLIDDLPSELDPDNRARVFSTLLS